MTELEKSTLNPLDDLSPHKVQGLLRAKGLSVPKFAGGRYKKSTVFSVISRFAGQNKVPRGITAINILKDLNNTIRG